MENQTVFAQGMFFKEPHQNAPAWVKGTLSIECEKFIEWMRSNCYKAQNGKWYTNIDIKASKDGVKYLALNEYKPKPQTAPQQSAPVQERPIQYQPEPVPENEINVENVPF